MFIVEIIAGLVAAVLVVGGVVNFNRWTVAKFSHRFFGWFPLILGAGAVWAVIGGMNALEGTGAGSAALLLIIVGFAVMAMLVAYNVTRTSLMVGLFGSAVQLAAYTAAGLLGIAVAVPALFIAVAAAFGRAEPTMRQHHHYADHDPASAL